MSANDHQPPPAEAATDVGNNDAEEVDRSFAFVAITVSVAVATIALLAFFWPSV